MHAAASGSFVERRNGSRHVWFLNSAFDKIGLDTALRRITERDPASPFAFVVTPNVDHLVRLEHDTVLATLYAQAWLTVCDSRILELIGRMSGERIDIAPGSDLTARLFDTAIDPDEPLTIIGGNRAVIDAVTARYGLKDVRWHEPPMGLRNNPEAVAECAKFVAENPSRFVLICVGSPQQEMIAEACLDRGDCTGVGLCVGASLDFLGGKARRAPVWVQRARLEWLHRLAQEPGRMWRRYLVEGPKVFLLWRRWRKTQRELRALERALSQPDRVKERALHQRIRNLEAQLASRE
ncbi:MAG: glycosyltransferase [Oceanicaulis sp.]|uniref:Glycosyl transferase n=1 Tax=Maricaulis virginensis TaxID=144022 RepID=A0A9W6IMB3_9PROT|nr:WecB/TagA/CpsF family glycosyltransferase [Maricaulis virginensis]MAC38833.1 glycosyltransferase [Oceanicaulis sp.]MAZ90742.1 glycosyltransferase [Maricaulis sp.]MBI75498.1 glycosyltransferase [Oceanicaulis sp.]GLK52643.1 glycosyl transferase [Maricaulis virginensis]|tara:strand:+ start:1022 stop:1906 length:885 start_codon:yes stop_codon:yes gene_type:complete